MSEETTGGSVTFTIDVPSRRIEELKQLLEGLDVRLDPKRQVIAFNEGMMSQSVAMGHHLPGMVEGVNHYLDEAKLTPRIPENHEKWSILHRQEFLQFAIDNFDWEDSTVNYTWWDGEGIAWQEITRDNPLVFEEGE